MKRKKVYFITVVVGFAICMVGVIFGSRLVFQRTCERRTTPWSDLGTADDDEYRILIDAYKIKNQSNETVMIQAFDNTKLIGHYYEREKGAPLIVFFHGLWGHSYLDGVPIYRITQKHNWNLLLCDLRAQGDSEGEFSTLGVLEKYDCLDWVEWAQNRFGDKNPIFLFGVLYASRCNNFHGNVAARMNSINANKDTFKMYTDMFLTEYIILAIHLNSQGALSDMVLNKVKENANLMV